MFFSDIFFTMNETHFLKDNDNKSENIKKSRNLTNFDQLPLSHEHIIRTILLYSDSKTLSVCEKVCSTWNWWISSSRIWTEMLAKKVPSQELVLVNQVMQLFCWGGLA